ncbi:MAG: carbonic anhydrase family protein [Bacteroidota bacterium]|nr:carbonic anhydrase family protein [Bacteroidota bacterium]
MNKKLFIIFAGIIALSLTACNQAGPKSGQADEKQNIASEKVTEVMTKQMQDQLTPDAVLEDLLQGNERYVSGELISRDLPAQIEATTDSQYPKAVVLACIDSRVPVEYIFDQGVGDIFVVRVAGNIENTELLGSMEYGLGVAGSKLLMVLGHENCGAVKSAIQKVDVGSDNVTALLNEIEPAIQSVEGERNANDKSYFDHVIKNNVHLTIENIRNRSSIISDLEKEGKVKIVGAYYSLADGKVSILQNETHEGHDH